MAGWEESVDRLYRVPPEEFTAARRETAARAREAGDRELARTVGGLRRPTRAAWASNLLVRRRPEEADRLLRLGRDLRRAHHDVDAERLRDLVRQQRQLVGALAGQAAQLTAEAGRRVGVDARREVEQTLRAVLADADAARRWREGRLTRALRAPSGVEPLTGQRPATPRPVQEPAREGGDRDERGRRLARTRAEEVARRWRARERERQAAEEEVRRARDRRDEARRSAAELAERERRARTARRRAEAELRRARDRLANAASGARRAHRRAQQAASRAGLPDSAG